MSKSLLLASSMMVALATTSLANAEILFRGVITITAVTNCPNGPNVGDLDHAQFHPKAAPGNANFSALNRIYDFGGVSYRLDGKNFTPTFQRVANKSLGWADYTPDKPAFVLVSKQVPTAIVASTPSITLTGQIKNPFGETGSETCIATFQMIGVKNSQ